MSKHRLTGRRSTGVDVAVVVDGGHERAEHHLLLESDPLPGAIAVDLDPCPRPDVVHTEREVVARELEANHGDLKSSQLELPPAARRATRHRHRGYGTEWT